VEFAPFCCSIPPDAFRGRALLAAPEFKPLSWLASAWHRTFRRNYYRPGRAWTDAPPTGVRYPPRAGTELAATTGTAFSGRHLRLDWLRGAPGWFCRFPPDVLATTLPYRSVGHPPPDVPVPRAIAVVWRSLGTSRVAPTTAVWAGAPPPVRTSRAAGISERFALT